MASLLGVIGVTVAQMSEDAGALSTYALGAVQGALLALLLRELLSAPRSTLTKEAVPIAVPPPSVAADEPPEVDQVTPRTLLKNVSAVESLALVPVTLGRTIEVEYSLDEYESLKQQKVDQAPLEEKTPRRSSSSKSPSKRSSTDGAAPPDAEPPESKRSRRKSVRTPKAVKRLGEED